MSADRHWWNDDLISAAQRVSHGQAAVGMVESGAPDGPGALVSLPCWLWREAAIDMGRKDVASDGGRLMMPVAVTWTDGPLVVVPAGQSVTAEYTYCGLGHCGSGVVELSTTENVREVTTHHDTATVPGSIVALSVPARRIHALLNQAIEDGATARWTMFEMLRPVVAKSVERARRRYAAEVSAYTGPLSNELIDSTAAEAAITHIMFGSDNHRGYADPMITKITNAGTRFARVDPARWVSTEMSRNSMDYLRSSIEGRCGGKVRSVAMDIGTRDLMEVDLAYRKRYPYDSLSLEMVQRALTIHEREAPSLVWSFHDEAAVEGDFVDTLLDRIAS